MARCKILKMGSGFLPMILGGGLHAYRVVKDSLPGRAEIVGVSMGPDLRTILLLIQSDEFPEVPEGMPYPEVMPVITTAYDCMPPTDL